MQIDNFEKEFVERTKEIIDNISCIHDFKYEVTLMINCLAGLVMLPTERMQNKDEYINCCVDKLKELDCIKTDQTNEKNKIFRTLKNSISHMNIEIVNDGGFISKIIFSDRDNRHNPFHTVLEFSIEKLKKYALFMADEYLKGRFSHGIHRSQL